MIILNLLGFLLCDTTYTDAVVSDIAFYEKYTIFKLNDFDKHNLEDVNDEYYIKLKEMSESDSVADFSLFDFKVNDNTHTFILKREFKLLNNTKYFVNYIPFVYLDEKLKKDECTDTNFLIYYGFAEYSAIKNDDVMKYNLFCLKKNNLPEGLLYKNEILLDGENLEESEESEEENKYCSSLYKLHGNDLNQFSISWEDDLFTLRKNNFKISNKTDLYEIVFLQEENKINFIEKNEGDSSEFLEKLPNKSFMSIFMDIQEFLKFLNDTNRDEMSYNVKCKFNQENTIDVSFLDINDKDVKCLENRNIYQLLDKYLNPNIKSSYIIDDVVIKDVIFNEKYNVYKLFDNKLNDEIITSIKKDQNLFDFSFVTISIEDKPGKDNKKRFLITKELMLKKDTELTCGNKIYKINNENTNFILKEKCNLQLQNCESTWEDDLEKTENEKNRNGHNVFLIKRELDEDKKKKTFGFVPYLSKEQNPDIIKANFISFDYEMNEYCDYFDSSNRDLLKGILLNYDHNFNIFCFYGKKQIVINCNNFWHMLVNMNFNQFIDFINSNDKTVLSYQTEVEILDKNAKIIINSNKLDDIATYIGEVKKKQKI
ncbi:hypothetical protein EHP00_1530 [Ecytonucleospora hepatopenaei]|uniref:Uncharacterized protein n=1 Tax=Ecytonucleospora hepatopenaei TaxID=646526 RepID=A0A1W0E3W3_9MICR|nr:hypothetical protein EHP00_1530 [Ecytonucleospora hepatopenaei]